MRNGSAVSQNNHAVAGFTNSPNSSPVTEKIAFETVNPISLLTNGSRFITFSVNAAAISCGAGGPLYKFYLVDPSANTETATFTTPINPCASGGSGTFASNSAILFSGASLKIRMKNGNGSNAGNDAAFDDIKVLDATPQLDKSFSPVNQTVGQTSTLTFTITNTTDLAAKSGWSFTDTLPAGLTLATPASASTTCPAGSVTAASGGNTVAISGGSLTAGMASCKVTVAVTSNAIGTYTNNASNITSSVGLNPPGSASVTFGVGSFANLGTTVNLPTAALVGSTVTGSFTCTNSGVSSAVNATCSIVGLPPAATISCTPSVPVTSLASGSAVVCNVSFVMPATPVSATATAASSTPDPDTANNTASATVAPSSSADMRASVSLPSAVLVGNTVTGSFSCTNGGPDSAIAASCSIAGLPATAVIRCAPTVPTSAPLASGNSVVCNVSYVMPSTPVNATATAGSSTPDPTPTNNTASATVAPSSSADMRAAVSLPTAALVGSTVTGSFTCTNDGPDSAIAASCGITGLPAAAVISCTPTVPTSAPLASGSAVVCSVSYVMPGTAVSVTVTAGSNTPDPTPANNTASATVAPSSSADMRAAVSLPTAALVGSTVTGSFTCTNGGPDSAIAASCSISGLPAAAVIGCTPTLPVAYLASGNAVVCNVSYVMPSTPVSAVVTAGSNTPDPTTTNNTARATVSNPVDSITGVPMDEPWMLISLILLLTGVVGTQQAVRRKR